MNCIVALGQILSVEYASVEDIDSFIDRLPNTLVMEELTLVGGASWTEIDFLTESASLSSSPVKGTEKPTSYEVPMQIPFMDEETLLLVNQLKLGAYLLKVTDFNKNVFILGRPEAGGRFTSSGSISATPEGGQSMDLVYQVNIRKSLLKL